MTSTQRKPTGWIGFAHKDLGYARAVMAEVERACRYFYVRPIPKYSGNRKYSGMSDDEVIRRVKAFDQGENEREAGERKFPVSDLPIEWKRALIQNIEAIKARYCFEWVD